MLNYITSLVWWAKLSSDHKRLIICKILHGPLLKLVWKVKKVGLEIQEQFFTSTFPLERTKLSKYMEDINGTERYVLFISQTLPTGKGTGSLVKCFKSLWEWFSTVLNTSTSIINSVLCRTQVLHLLVSAAVWDHKINLHQWRLSKY